MKQSELINLLKSFDTRINTINERTKNHTIYIKNLEKEVKILKEKK